MEAEEEGEVDRPWLTRWEEEVAAGEVTVEAIVGGGVVGRAEGTARREEGQRSPQRLEQ